MAEDSPKHGKTVVMCGIDSTTGETRFVSTNTTGQVETTTASPTISSMSTWKTVAVDTTATGIELLAANTARKLLLLVNNGSTDIYVGFGSVTSGAAASTTGGFLLKSGGGSIILDGPMVTSQIKAITTSSSSVVFVAEGG